jgi:hypothetical protein
MGAIKNLWQSERGLVGMALIIAASVLCGMHAIGADQWLDYTKWVFVTYAAAKTISGTVSALAAPQPPVESPVPAPLAIDASKFPPSVLAHILAGNLPSTAPAPDSTVVSTTVLHTQPPA